MNEIKYLTPQEVIKFQELGIDFGLTENIYHKYSRYDIICGLIEVDWYNQSRRERENSLAGYDTSETIPCPNTEDLIRILPKAIHTSSCALSLYLMWNTNGCDLDVGYVNDKKTRQTHENPLIALKNLLNYLIDNYPESLKIKPHQVNPKLLQYHFLSNKGILYSDKRNIIEKIFPNSYDDNDSTHINCINFLKKLNDEQKNIVWEMIKKYL